MCVRTRSESCSRKRTGLAISIYLRLRPVNWSNSRGHETGRARNPGHRDYYFSALSNDVFFNVPPDVDGLLARLKCNGHCATAAAALVLPLPVCVCVYVCAQTNRAPFARRYCIINTLLRVADGSIRSKLHCHTAHATGRSRARDPRAHTQRERHPVLK